MPNVKEVVALRHVIEQVQTFFIIPRIHFISLFRPVDFYYLALANIAETAVKSSMLLTKIRSALQFEEGKNIPGYMVAFFQRVSVDS